jgi:hypothetical protein
LNNPPERSRGRIAHAALLAVALTAALAAGRSREVALDLRVDPDTPPPAVAPAPPAHEVLDDGAVELFRGFYPLESPPDAPSFRWMGASGVIRLQHREPAMILSFTGYLPPDNRAAATIAVQFDGKPLERFQAPAGRFTRSYTLTDLAPRPGGHRVFLHVSPAVTTPPPEPRELGLGIESITWLPGTGDGG